MSEPTLMCTACTLLVGRPMDHSTLSIKNCGQHISANRQLYVNEAKSGRSEGATLIGRSGLVSARVLAATGYVCAMYPE